jgi:Protein of unknown function (DUF3467)
MTQPRRPSKIKSETEHQVNSQARETEYRQAADFDSHYANSVQLKVTPWDIQCIFGKILSLDEMKMVIENELAVYISPQTAKSLLKVLAGVVQQYEEKIGEIQYGERQDTPDSGVS